MTARARPAPLASVRHAAGVGALLGTSWWRYALVLTVLLGGVGLALRTAFDGGVTTDGVASSAVAAVLYGPVLGLVLARRARWSRRVTARLGRLTPAELREARRAADRGPVPEDARVRDAALWLAELRHEGTLRVRRAATVVWTVLLLVDLAVVLVAPGWPWWYGVALVALGLAATWWVPRDRAARVARLRGDDPAPAA